MAPSETPASSSARFQEDPEFPYPVSVGTTGRLSLQNALEGIFFLYVESGMIKRSTLASEYNNDTQRAISAKKMEWFTYTEQVIPSGIMRIVSTLAYPTPRGVRILSRDAVKALFDDKRRFLLEYEPRDVLQKLTYIELDEARFAFMALRGLVLEDGHEVFNNVWELTPLAARDLKKNSTVNESASALSAGKSKETQRGECTKPGRTKGGTGSSGLLRTDPTKNSRPVATKEQRQMKALLDEAVAEMWPHTPSSKSAIFTVEQDPNQPRHRPLFRATVSFPLLKNERVNKAEGQWMAIKRDAENMAAEAALKLLHTLKKKK